jgi:hypothetical protein
MKKISVTLVMALFVLSAMSLISSQTIIAGKIYNVDYTAIIPGASVTVECDEAVGNTTSVVDGSYAVSFSDDSACNGTDTVTVSATKGELTGSASGTVQGNLIQGLDIAIVNVPLVPEFGLVIGGLTIFGAVAVFFMIRKQ